MKKNISLLFVLIVFRANSFSQNTLANDDFGTVAQNPLNRNGWISNSGGGSSWELRTTAASSGYPGASAGANIFTNLGSNLNTKTLTYDNSLSTMAYSLIILKFGGIKTGTVPALVMSFSTDGINFNAFQGNSVNLTTSWTLYTLALPAAASHQLNLRVRIEIQANNNSANNFRLDDFRIDGTADAPLPVRFSFFRVLKSGDQNQLQWVTASEQDNLGFEVQRSLDGNNFNPIGFVPTSARDGNSSGELQYVFNDVRPVGLSQFYRLRQVDRDQRSSFTEVVLIRRDPPASWKIGSPYPNPVKDKLWMPLYVPINCSAQLSVTDLAGKIIIHNNIVLVAGKNWVEIRMDKLSPGRYELILHHAGGNTAVTGFIKQ